MIWDVFTPTILFIIVAIAEFGVNVLAIYLFLDKKLNYRIIAFIHAFLIPTVILLAFHMIGIPLNSTAVLSLWEIYVGIQAMAIGIHTVLTDGGIGSLGDPDEEDTLHLFSLMTVLPFPFVALGLCYAIVNLLALWGKDLITGVVFAISFISSLMIYYAVVKLKEV